MAADAGACSLLPGNPSFRFDSALSTLSLNSQWGVSPVSGLCKVSGGGTPSVFCAWVSGHIQVTFLLSQVLPQLPDRLQRGGASRREAEAKQEEGEDGISHVILPSGLGQGEAHTSYFVPVPVPHSQCSHSLLHMAGHGLCGPHQRVYHCARQPFRAHPWRPCGHHVALQSPGIC